MKKAARERAAELAKANEALLGCLDSLASVPELDEFLGQVMGAMTRQLGAASSVLRMLNFEKDVLTLDLVFQDGRVMTPAEAKYPERLQTIPLDKRQLSLLKQPAAVNSVALHLRETNRLTEAEPLFRQVLHILAEFGIAKARASTPPHSHT